MMGHERQHEQQERHEHDDVAVALEVARAPHDEQGGGVGDDAEQRPGRLVGQGASAAISHESSSR